MARARGKITSGVTRGGRKNKALTWTAPIERIFDQAVEDKDTVVLETLLANASAGHAFLTYDLSNIKQVWLRAKGHKIELRDLLYFVVEKGDLKTTKFLLKYGQAHELQYPEVLTIAAIAKRNRSDIFCCLLQQDWVKWYPDSRTGLFVAKVVAKCGSQRDKKLSNKCVSRSIFMLH
jgi:hypothetical protein